MKSFLLIIFAVIMGMAQLASGATGYRYVSAAQLKGWLEAARPALIVDIQPNKDFAEHHIKGSLETNAYPARSEGDRQLLVPALERIRARGHDAVVVVCPRGKGGAQRTYDFFKEQGVAETRLFILTGGMGNWPYPEWVESE